MTDMLMFGKFYFNTETVHRVNTPYAIPSKGIQELLKIILNCTLKHVYNLMLTIHSAVQFR